jgi:hypothetical protein
VSEPADRVVPAFQTLHDASQRFDYFVTGGAGAALAFSLERFDPGALPYGQVLVPVAWLLLLVSLGAGLVHLEATVAVLRQAALQQEMSAEASMPVDVARDLLRRSDAKIAKEQRRSVVAYWVRNTALFGGFIALGVWKTMNL